MSVNHGAVCQWTGAVYRPLDKRAKVSNGRASKWATECHDCHLNVEVSSSLIQRDVFTGVRRNGTMRGIKVATD